MAALITRVLHPLCLLGIVTALAAAQGFGETPAFKTQWTGDGWRYPKMFKEWQADDNFKFPFFLQPPKHYVGAAWYQREFDIPKSWTDSRAVLQLERVHWHSSCWIDGREIGKGDSLGTPHEFELVSLTPGTHVLTLRIDNRIREVNVGPLSHSVTDHTQGNWNGIVGEIALARQWWEIQQNAQPFILPELPSVKPLVQVIDDWFTNRKLGYVFEARVGTGRLLACGADLASKLGQRPAARQLSASLLEHLGGTRFAPGVTLAPAAMERLINP